MITNNIFKYSLCCLQGLSMRRVFRTNSHIHANSTILGSVLFYQPQFQSTAILRAPPHLLYQPYLQSQPLEQHCLNWNNFFSPKDFFTISEVGIKHSLKLESSWFNFSLPFNLISFICLVFFLLPAPIIVQRVRSLCSFECKGLSACMLIISFPSICCFSAVVEFSYTPWLGFVHMNN